MRQQLFSWFLIPILAFAVIACTAPPTATPRPTSPPTPTLPPWPTSPPALTLASLPVPTVANPTPTPSLTIEDTMFLGAVCDDYLAARTKVLQADLSITDFKLALLDEGMPATEIALMESQCSPPTASHGLPIMPENRCEPYNPDDYPYPQSVEDEIISNYGGYIYGPYTQTLFASKQETDIEHIVARSEAHDSGLCAASPERKARFASDYFNLTLASPSVNRHQKRANDVAEWLPEKNQCWYVNRVVDVKKEYGLSVDQAESDAIDIVLSHCISLLPKEMIGPWGESDGNPDRK